MQKTFLALTAAASLLAVPALAQSNQSNSTQSNQANSGSSAAGQSSSQAGASQQMSQADLTQLQHKITSDLQQDGYKNVRVVPNSFLVHAENKQGHPVVMIINPDSVFAMTTVDASGNGNPGSAQGNATGSQRGSLGSSGAATNGNTGAGNRPTRQ